MEKLVGIRIVRDLQVLTIPEQLFPAVADADTAEQNGLGQGPRKIKIGPRRRTAFAGLDPFLVVADGTRQGLERTLVLFVAAFGQQAGMLPAPAGYQHLAFVAHENNPIFAIELAVLLQFSRPFRRQSAIIPM